MAGRALAAILIVLFACFLFIALSDILKIVESGSFGGVPLLLFSVVVCVGWIGFLAPLCWPRLSNPFHFADR
jgi:hypothetical protein